MIFMEHHNHDNHFGTIGLIMSALSWAINGIDLSGADSTLFEPVAHIAAIVSGFCGATLFMLSIIEKIRGKK